MPANWNNPTVTSNYSTGVLQVISERLVDAVSLFHTDGTNIPDTAIKFNRIGIKFQERIAGAWSDIVLSVAAGGTGSHFASGARVNLGLGTMAEQAAGAVAITGGTLAGITSLAATAITASGTITAALFSGSGASLTALNGSNISSGTVAPARLGSGTPNSSNFLRGDGTWAIPADAPGVPSGLIAMFDVACPSGWTRFAALDARVPVGDAAYGETGGSSIHTHTLSTDGAHTHGVSGVTGETDVSHNHGGVTGFENSTIPAGNGPGITVASQNHTHTIPTSGSLLHGHSAGSLSANSSGAHTHTLGSVNQYPPYLKVVWCKKD